MSCSKSRCEPECSRLSAFSIHTTQVDASACRRCTHCTDVGHILQIRPGLHARPCNAVASECFQETAWRYHVHHPITPLVLCSQWYGSRCTAIQFCMSQVHPECSCGLILYHIDLTMMPTTRTQQITPINRHPDEIGGLPRFNLASLRYMPCASPPMMSRSRSAVTERIINALCANYITSH